MIFISSNCVDIRRVGETVSYLFQHGFRNIELTGGTEYYDAFKEDLINFRNQHNVTFLCHNYFPPPKEHFVLNLASLNDNIYNKSINWYKQAIDLSKELGATKYGFHAGSYMDLELSELGREIAVRKVMGEPLICSVAKRSAIERFCDGYKFLKKYAGSAFDLYIENNVISQPNFQKNDKINPFMLTSYRDYCDLREKIDFKLLLDIAHLKVSSSVLGLDFGSELKSLLIESDYLHISDNNGLKDQHLNILKDSELFKSISCYPLNNKVISLEITGDISDIIDTYKQFERIVK